MPGGFVTSRYLRASGPVGAGPGDRGRDARFSHAPAVKHVYVGVHRQNPGFRARLKPFASWNRHFSSSVESLYFCGKVCA